MTPIEKPALPEPAIDGSQGVCCGNFATGGEYVGRRETLCCGQPDEAWPDSFSADQMHTYADTCMAPLLARIEELEAENAALVNMGLEQQLKHTDRIEELEKDAARWQELRLNRTFRVDRYYRGNWQKPDNFYDVIQAVDEAVAIRAALSATKEPS